MCVAFFNQIAILSRPELQLSEQAQRDTHVPKIPLTQRSTPTRLVWCTAGHPLDHVWCVSVAQLRQIPVDSQRAAAGASQIKIRGNAYGPDLSLAQVLLLVSMRPRRARVAFRLLDRAPNKPVEQAARNSSMSHCNGKPQPSQVHTYSALTICRCCKCCSSFHPGPSDAPWIVERMAWATYTVGMIETAQYVARNPGPSVSRRCEQESGNVYAPRLH